MLKNSYRFVEFFALVGCLIYLQSKGITFWGNMTVVLTAVVWKAGGYMEDRK